MKKLLLLNIALIPLTAIAIFVYLLTKYPAVDPAPDIQAPTSNEAVERGAYLANHVSACMSCHSGRDFTRYAAPLIPAELGSGGYIFGESMGYLGTFIATNLTPYGLKHQSDGEILRAFTAGVNAKGRALHPLMPYLSYGKMSREDALAIVAYLRSLPEVPFDTNPSKAKFPMSLIVRTIPQKAQLLPATPDRDNTVDYGAYLTTIAGCTDCHTKTVDGQAVDGLQLAGGFEFRMPQGILRSSNLTPDPLTGLGGWTEATFVKKFKLMDPATGSKTAELKGSMNTVMPWTFYAGMSEEDLKAIFAYLQSLPPVANQVDIKTYDKK